MWLTELYVRHVIATQIVCTTVIIYFEITLFSPYTYRRVSERNNET